VQVSHRNKRSVSPPGISDIVKTFPLSLNWSDETIEALAGVAAVTAVLLTGFVSEAATDQRVHSDS
jgi:hypothetical protein